MTQEWFDKDVKVPLTQHGNLLAVRQLLFSVDEKTRNF